MLAQLAALEAALSAGTLQVVETPSEAPDNGSYGGEDTPSDGASVEVPDGERPALTTVD